MIDVIVIILGIGLVILVHELGHFFAARYSGVRVEAFSIGFGPVLVKYKRGETEYRISLIPLGGYVKMAGESLGEGKGQADELGSKEPRFRALIFAAGVVMNVIFAFIFFMIAFAAGVPFRAPEVGHVTKGGPAWEAGLPEGSTVVSVNDQHVYSFSDITTEIALSEGPVTLEVKVPETEAVQEFVIQPDADQRRGFRMIRMEAAYQDDFTLQVAKGGPAEKVGIGNGDRLLSMGGIPAAELKRHNIEKLMGKNEPLKLQVLPGGSGPEADKAIAVTIIPKVDTTSGRQVIGIKPLMRRIKAVRKGSPLVKKAGLDKGDVILKVDDRQILGRESFEQSLSQRQGMVELLVRKAGARQNTPLKLELQKGESEQLFADLALEADGNLVVPLDAGPAAAAGLKAADRVCRLNDVVIKDWNGLVDAITSADQGKISLQVMRGDKQLDLQITAKPMEMFDFGFAPMLTAKQTIVQGASPVAAVRHGIGSSWRMLRQIFLSLKGVFSGTVASRNLGGPIMIFQVSNTLLQQGLIKFLWFLAVISINLAFINILPIPVLDGGHLFFLLIEKIKGSPLSERVMIWAQMAGLAMVLGLIVFVTYNDILRAIGLQ